MTLNDVAKSFSHFCVNNTGYMGGDVIVFGVEECLNCKGVTLQGSMGLHNVLPAQLKRMGMTELDSLPAESYYSEEVVCKEACENCL